MLPTVVVLLSRAPMIRGRLTVIDMGPRTIALMTKARGMAEQLETNILLETVMEVGVEVMGVKIKCIQTKVKITGAKVKDIVVEHIVRAQSSITEETIGHHMVIQPARVVQGMVDMALRGTNILSIDISFQQPSFNGLEVKHESLSSRDSCAGSCEIVSLQPET